MIHYPVLRLSVSKTRERRKVKFIDCRKRLTARKTLHGEVSRVGIRVKILYRVCMRISPKHQATVALYMGSGWWDSQTHDHHVEDSDYFAQREHNCCLCNLEDMLQNGTVISETMIEKPNSFLTACNIATQIIASVSSNQYGKNRLPLR